MNFATIALVAAIAVGSGGTQHELDSTVDADLLHAADALTAQLAAAPPSGADWERHRERFMAWIDSGADWERLMAWIDSVQNPPSCSGAKFVEIRDRGGQGIGSLATCVHQSFIMLLAQGNAAMFDMTHKISFADPALCAAQDWTCFFKPLTKCRHNPGVVLTYRNRDACASYDPTKLQDLAGLAQPHSRRFYEAAVAAYFMRPNARLLAAEAALREEINLPASGDANHLSLYIRHGDSGNDGRAWIPLEHYAALAEVVEYWNMPGVATIFLGSDDRKAVKDLKEHFANKQAVHDGLSGVRITHIPDKYFLSLSNDFVRSDRSVAREMKSIIAKMEGQTTPASAKGWDEGTVLLAQVRIFAATQGVIGTMSANEFKVVFLLASARSQGEHPPGVWDAIGDTYFGCNMQRRFPHGDWAQYAANNRDQWLRNECAMKPPTVGEDPNAREGGLEKECKRLGAR